MKEYSRYLLEKKVCISETTCIQCVDYESCITLEFAPDLQFKECDSFLDKNTDPDLIYALDTLIARKRDDETITLEEASNLPYCSTKKKKQGTICMYMYIHLRQRSH